MQTARYFIQHWLAGKKEKDKSALEKFAKVEALHIQDQIPFHDPECLKNPPKVNFEFANRRCNLFMSNSSQSG